MPRVASAGLYRRTACRRAAHHHRRGRGGHHRQDARNHAARRDPLEHALDGEGGRHQPHDGRPHLADVPAAAAPHASRSSCRPIRSSSRRSAMSSGSTCAPPANAVVFSVDEKSQIQALQRAQPILPMDFGQPERRTHNYVRHGTLDLFAALNVATGEVIARCKPQHRAQDFVAFLREIDAASSRRLTSTSSSIICRPTARPRCSGGCCAIPASISFHAHLRVVAQPGGALLWIADRESAQTWIAHQHCAIARGHPRLRRRPQRPRHTVQMGEDRRRDPRQHAAIRPSRAAGPRSVTRLILSSMERPTSALHRTRVTLSLRQLGAEPHTKEVGRDKSTTIIALDQHAATTVAAVLLRGTARLHCIP